MGVTVYVCHVCHSDMNTTFSSCKDAHTHILQTFQVTFSGKPCCLIATMSHFVGMCVQVIVSVSLNVSFYFE
jgi:hypothetical protein